MQLLTRTLGVARRAAFGAVATTQAAAGVAAYGPVAARRCAAFAIHPLPQHFQQRCLMQGGTNSVSSFRLDIFPAMIPHPDKAAKGGEDAYFVLEARPEGPMHSAAGVADGVGGWAEQGVDAGLYSKSLMKWTHQRLKDAEVPCVHDALAFSYRMTKMMGSCTACVVMLNEGNLLETLNLGDSGFLLARPSEEGGTEKYSIVFKTTEQQHRFNMPFQLGTYSQDLPKHADFKTLEVKSGDVILMATDGVWDNVFEEDLLHMIEQAAGNLKSAAMHIAETSMKIGMSNKPTPFSTRAQEAGLQYFGGKLDDVTVVLAQVTPTTHVPPQS